jgi:lysophospholipid acyltransferase (LPLAT)-like uncharacterized protein
MSDAAPPAREPRDARDRPIPRWLPVVGAATLRAWGATWRLRTRVAPAVDPLRSPRTSGCIYLLWHRTMLIGLHTYRKSGLCIGVSQHRDGEIGAQIAERSGIKTARGSSTRGGSKLVLAMLDFARADRGDLALTPDGPKGPARRSKPGALFLAAQLGWPVVPMAFTARPRKELRTWDRFILPAPFAKVGIVSGEPLTVDRDTSDAGLTGLCAEIDRRMELAEQQAEELVA